MGGLSSFLKWLPLIDGLVTLAEGIFGSGAGKDKKAFVQETLGAVASAGADLYQKNSGKVLPLTDLMPVVSHLIDAAAGALFPKDEGLSQEEQAP